MEAQVAEQKRLVSRRQVIYATVQRTYEAFAHLKPEDADLSKPRFEELSTLKSDFQEIQLSIADLNTQLIPPTKPIEVDKVFDSFETVIYAAQARFLAAVKLGQEQLKAEPTVSKSSITLPTIELPTFSGDISKWTEYYSLFISLIDENNSLNNVQKFHYLRTSLTDSALATISDFQISNDSYPLALEALVSRYQNNRLLASLYVQKILEFTPLKSASHSGLQSFLSVHRNAVDALKALQLPDLGDFLLLSLTLANLDPSTRKAFENKHSSHTTPTYKSVIDFIEEQSRTMELCAVGKQQTSSAVKSSPSSKRINSLLAAKEATPPAGSWRVRSDTSRPMVKQYSCPVCKASHTLYQCDNFRKQSIDDKYRTLRELRRCFNCLGSHMQSQCASKSTCSACGSNRHHSMLHSATVSTSNDNLLVTALPSQIVTLPAQDAISSSQALTCHLRTAPIKHRTVLLGTVRALIRDSNGQLQPFRAVLDPGSQVSAITRSLVHKLGLKVQPSHSELSGIGLAAARVCGNVQCVIASRFAPDRDLKVQALVMPAIASQLPTCQVPREVLERFRGLSLADTRFHVPDQVDVLLGADIYPEILNKSGDMVIGGCPSAINTVFGWVVLGPSDSVKPLPQQSLSLLTVTNLSLDNTLRLFWESEEVSRPTAVDPLDMLVEEHFLNTHSRDDSGRYSVALPFKPCSPTLGRNREAALQNYLHLERRLQRNLEHKDAYLEFMRNYEQSQHMQPASTPSSYVIPHHCVHKLTSSSTKLRVVFNASSPDENGVSLNQLLLSGPKLQHDLPSVITTFRTHPIVICADIRQMYRQILVDPSDRAYQHIFWRPTPSSPVLEYELNTVTYGLTPSAFQAQRVLQQLVHDEGEPYPLAARALEYHTYIDDIASGAETLAEALALQSQLQTLLARGGFELRKWASNNPVVLAALPDNHLETPLVFSSGDEGIKILGLLWNSDADDFSFHSQPFEGLVTKRAVLSYIARIFDPLGFATPFVCLMKIFLQQLWLTQVQWDDALPEQLSTSWLSVVAEVSELTSFRVPRAFPQDGNSRCIVGFCDASEKAYAAVLYLHTQTSHSVPHVCLVRAKSKVAPVKPLTIPKLELSAALLLTKLLRITLPSLASLNVTSIHLFTDSQIVLSWFSTPPHRLKTFVANRVVEVLESTSRNDWAHVPSEENPADCASRGLSPSQLLEHPLWLSGPQFLRSPPDLWRGSSPTVDSDTELPELKPSPITLVAHVNDPNPWLINFEKFSTLLKAQRVFSWVFRFGRILLAKHLKVSPPSGALKPSELKDSLDLFVRLTQHQYYGTEIRQLAQNKPVSSRLASLKPFLDPSGLLRVGGRLRHSSLSEEARHPLLLPKEAHLSALICDSFHKSSLHSGPRTVQALIQQCFWIVSLRGLLRQRIHRCLTCHKFRSKPLQPEMADLPASRVQTSRVFSHVGTDFAGPFMVKTSIRRNAPLSKGYLCIFVCMATKAVHLEFVSELSTEAFLACLDRFLARRGLPSHIYSDCGRNYVGAARQLREFHDLLSQSEVPITNSLASRKVSWHFNPPHAPNFGGLWEAVVKSSKSLLYRLIGDTSLTHEEYATLFARIEAVLNSRPLCASSNDPTEGTDYLSPGHFLIGAPLLSPPERILDENIRPVTRWHRVKQLHQSFWARWSSEYLHTLIQRSKWVRGSPTLNVGDVVFFYSASTSPLSWPIGRVEALFPGRDGVTRVASVRSASGVFTRPVNKLVTLPSA